MIQIGMLADMSWYECNTDLLTPSWVFESMFWFIQGG